MTIQLNLFEEAHFDGKTYEKKYDKKRLTTQLKKVFNLMQDGKWRTLQEMERALKQPQASISARLRDLRKEKFGGHAVNRKSASGREKGHFKYQLIVKQ